MHAYIQDGDTSLILAIKNGHQDTVQILLKHDADVNYADKVNMYMFVRVYVCVCARLIVYVFVFVCVCVCVCVCVILRVHIDIV